MNNNKVLPFSVEHPLNLPTPYAKYFLSGLTNHRDEIYYKDLKKSPYNILKLLQRNFYSFEAKRNINKLFRSNPVDVAYLLHFLKWISPSILDYLSQKKIPIIVRLSDFSFICPSSNFLRNKSICELCKNGNLWPSIKYKCSQNSTMTSVVNALAISFHKFFHLFDKVDAFVCPSKFTLDKMKEAGFPENKLHHIPTFVNANDYMPHYDNGKYILYYGRISKEKGVEFLINAYAKLARSNKIAQLIIVGRSNDEEAERLKRKILNENIPNIEIRDEVPPNEIQQLIYNSVFIVVPSIWFDNMPNTILESYAAGKPVLASNFGSFPELIRPEVTGMLFQPAAVDDLAQKIQWMLSHPNEIKLMGINARKYAEQNFLPQLHYKRLMNLFNKIILSKN